MIEVAVAHDQALHFRAVDAHDVHVVHQRVGRVTKIEHEMARVGADLRFQRERQPPLVVQRFAVIRLRNKAAASHLHPFVAAGSRRVVGAVGDDADGETVHRGHAEFRRLGRQRIADAHLREHSGRAEYELAAIQIQ